MKTIKMNPLFLAMAIAAPAMAQEASDAPVVEEVLVTGFRQTIAQALDLKRDSVGQQDSILAEDIGKFPDLNIADSLQRIPGITITRDGGEGRNVQVRGLGANFTRVTINGMESSSSGDGLGGGSVSNNRQFDFNVFASELFTRVDVKKTQSAETESGISGGIDLYTAKPLDHAGLKVAYSAQMGYNDLNSEKTPRGSFLISNTFADDTVGVLFSIATSEANVRQEGHTSVRWQSNDGISTDLGVQAVDPADRLDPGASTPSAFFPRIPRASSRSFSQDRLGATFGLQFAPSDDLEISLNVMKAELDTVRQEYEFSAAMQTATSSIVPTAWVLDEQLDTRDGLPIPDSDQFYDGTVYEITAGTFDNVKLRSEAVREESSQDFWQGTIDANWTVNDRLKVKALVGRSQNHYIRPIENTMAIDSNNTTFSYSYVSALNSVDAIAAASGTMAERDRTVPFLWFDTDPTEAGMQINDVEDYQVGLTRSRSNWIENESDVAKVDVDFAISDTSSIKAGLEQRSLETFYTDSRTSGGQETYLAGASAVGMIVNGPVPDFGTGLDGMSANFASGTNWVAPNYDAFYSSYFLDTNGDVLAYEPILDDGAIFYGPTQQLIQGGRSFGISEEVFSAYVQYDFETELGGMALRGNVGVRFSDTTTTSLQFLTNDYAAVEADYEAELLADLTAGNAYLKARPNPLDYFGSLEGSYSNILPSFNLSLDITDELVGRFSGGQAITRANIGSLASSVNVDVFGGNVSTGNPSLEPYETDQLDFSLEWYFSEEGLLVFSVFWKDFTVAIQSDSETRPLTEAELDGYNIRSDFEDAVADGRITRNQDFTIRSTFNTTGQDYFGYEMSYQQPFTFLPETFDGLGIIFNLTSLSVDTDYSFNGYDLSGDRTNISPLSYNTTLYFDRDVWGVRMAYNWRDEYITRAGNRNGGNSEGTDAIGQLDLSARYDISDNFTVSFEAINLTDEHTLTWVDRNAQRPVNYLHTGTQFLVGLRGSF